MYRIYLRSTCNTNRQLIKAIFLLLIVIINSYQVSGQTLEVEWDGTEQDLIRFIENNKALFVIDGASNGGIDRFTFKIISQPGDTLTAAITFDEGGTVKLHHVVDTLSHFQDSMASSLVVLPDGTIAQRRYEIGDTTRGGIVFWVDETGEHGLVCAFADQSASKTWSDTTRHTFASRFSIYGGKTNTERVIIKMGYEGSAAKLCNEFTGGGYGDWYLPSAQELALMWENLERFGCPLNADPCPTSKGGFADTIYWSSTEHESNPDVAALGRDFSLGPNDNIPISKFSALAIRAVRTF